MPPVPPVPPIENRRFLRFWTGTRPGLERMMLASVPALVVGVVVSRYTNGYVGYVVGIGLLVAAVFVRRRRPVV